MRVTDSPPAALPLPASPSTSPQVVPSQPQVSSGSLARVRTHRDNDLSPQEERAKTLVEQSDSKMAVNYAFGLTEAANSTAQDARRDNFAPLTTAVEPDSTFGMAWANFTRALNSEPFATFARDNHIDLSKIRWYAKYGASLSAGLTNGTFKTFGEASPGWTRATADLSAAAEVLIGRAGGAFTYTGTNSAPTELVGRFYGHRSVPARLPMAGILLNTQTFPSLSDSNHYHHRHVSELQQQAIKDIAAMDASGPIPAVAPAQTIAARVIDADKEVARMSATALLMHRNEIHPADADTASGTLITPPEHSTLGQTIKAFNKAFQTPAVLDFLRRKNIDISTVSISLPSGDLLVPERNALRTIATVNDQSGWAELSVDIRALAKKLGDGTNELVPYQPDGSISIRKALNFYGVPATSRTLPETLTLSTALFQKGFPALNQEPPPTDERSRAVQQAQLVAIQQLEPQARTAAPITNIAERLFAEVPSLASGIASWLSFYIQRTSGDTTGLDINQLNVGVPDPQAPGQRKYTPFMPLVLKALADKESPVLPKNARLFDIRPDRLAHTGTPSDVPVDIDMKALNKTLLDLFSPEKLETINRTITRTYWNSPAFTAPSAFSGSRKSLLSRLLQNNLQRAGLKQPGLDDEQRKTIDMVVKHPEGKTRAAPQDPNSSPATVYRLTNGPENDETPNLLIHRSVTGPREILLLVEPSGKITPYDSWDALDQAGHVKSELTGNPFDAQATTIINRNLGATLSANPASAGATSQPQKNVQPQAWLNNANDAERFLMSELSQKLAGFIQSSKGQTYHSGIPDIRTYIHSQFDNQKLSIYPAEDLEVVYVAPASPVFAEPNSIQFNRTSMSLADMLMNNLSGLPRGGVFEVYYKPENRRVPELEGDGVLRDIFSKLDVGKNYPELLKRELLDDPTKKAERLSLFTQQVPLDLKLNALTLSIKGEAGFDTTGLRYIEEIFKPGPGTRTVDGKEITIRPLAFERKADNKTDRVDGAYLIEPKDAKTGPHILYRPLIADAPLLQFPTRQALLEAIQKPGKLQKDTLAWMADDTARQIYSGNGFTHPNVVLGVKIPFLGDLRGTPTNELTTDQPEAAKTLQQKLTAGQLIDHLYDENAQNLISLADRQTTSSAENRWATFKEGGFLLLGAVLPFMRGPVAGYVGLTLLLEGIREDLDTLSNSDNPDKAMAAADLLLNLAMLLLHARGLPKQGASERAATVGNWEEGQPLDYRAQTTTVRTPDGENARRLMVMKGTMKDMKPIQGNLFTFEDEYKNQTRLNINAHGRDLSFRQQYAGESSKIIYDGAEHTAQELFDHLLAKGVDPRKYENIRLLVCYSANGGENSFAAEFQKLVQKPVKAFAGTVTVTPSPELVNAEFESSIETYGPVNGTQLVADSYATYDTVDIVKNRNDISLLKNPLEYFLFTYVPVKFPTV